MRTLLFDIDGTLIDTGGAGREAMNEALRAAFGIEPTQKISFGGRTDRSLLSEMLRVHGQEVSPASFARLRTAFASLLPVALQRSAGRVLPGVEELLGCLANSPGIRLWCMTGNLVETAASKLRHFELHAYFENIVGGDHDEDRNDMARRARATLLAAHGEPAASDIVVIGDTVSDVQCGQAIGARVVACCTGCHSRETLAQAKPCVIVDDLSDVPELVRLLVR
jgi:phosphoglycolate phosphatase